MANINFWRAQVPRTLATQAHIHADHIDNTSSGSDGSSDSEDDSSDDDESSGGDSSDDEGSSDDESDDDTQDVSCVTIEPEAPAVTATVPSTTALAKPLVPTPTQIIAPKPVTYEKDSDEESSELSEWSDSSSLSGDDAANPVEVNVLPAGATLEAADDDSEDDAGSEAPSDITDFLTEHMDGVADSDSFYASDPPQPEPITVVNQPEIEEPVLPEVKPQRGRRISIKDNNPAEPVDTNDVSDMKSKRKRSLLSSSPIRLPQDQPPPGKRARLDNVENLAREVPVEQTRRPPQLNAPVAPAQRSPPRPTPSSSRPQAKQASSRIVPSAQRVATTSTQKAPQATAQIAVSVKKEAVTKKAPAPRKRAAPKAAAPAVNIPPSIADHFTSGAYRYEALSDANRAKLLAAYPSFTAEELTDAFFMKIANFTPAMKAKEFDCPAGGPGRCGLSLSFNELEAHVQKEHCHPTTGRPACMAHPKKNTGMFDCAGVTAMANHIAKEHWHLEWDKAVCIQCGKDGQSMKQDAMVKHWLDCSAVKKWART